MKIHFWVIVFFVLMCFSCKKHGIAPSAQSALLPPITDTGANTFGCLRDGLVFTPKVGPQVPFGQDLTCSYADNYLDINALADPGNGWLTQIIIEIYGQPITQGQSYSLKDVVTGNSFAIDDLSYDNYTSGMTYQTRNTAAGTLTITKLDMVKHIVSGTFNFKAIDNFADTIKITDGRFDLVYGQ